MAERLSADEGGLDRAAAIVRAGGVIAFPTDTVYGVGCLHGDDDALAALFQLKERPAERHVPVLAGSLEAALELGVTMDERGERAAAAFWPGPLTLVLPLRGGDARGAGETTLGVRVPDHDVARALLNRSGPLRASSANRSGRREALTADEVLAELGGSRLLAAVVDGGTAPGGRASSVVDVSVRPPRLLREGALSRDRLEAVVGPLD